MLGGTYLCYEGAEKIVQKIKANPEEEQERAVNKTPEDEDSLVKGAIMTDLILSAEIMIIALDEVADQPIWMEAAVLVSVGILITIAVYGAVAILVKIDDIGRGMIERDKAPTLGRGLVKGMPYILTAIGVVGTVAMLWVGGHLIVRGLHEVVGWHWPHDVSEHLKEAAGGGALGWLAETGVSLTAGLITGFIVLGIVALLGKMLGNVRGAKANA